MFLISRFMFDAVYRPKGFLQIEQYVEANFVSTFYYFRLGARNVNDKPSEIDWQEGLVVPGNSTAQVWSLESFKLNERVLGLFGTNSGLTQKGLQLVNSPSIDPTFEGALELAIRNNSDKPVRLEAGERIGKVLFFDVSDTVVSADEFVKSLLTQKELEERRRAAEKLGQLAFSIARGTPE